MQNLVELSISSAINVLVGTLMGGIISLLLARWRERNHLEREIAELKASIKSVNDDIKEELSGLKEAESAVLKNTIRYSCKNRIKDGWIPLDEKQDILDCYQAYERIVKSNGVIDDAIKEMRSLPNRKP